MYGGDRKKLAKLQPVDRSFARQIRKCFTRQALHSRKLGLVHPKTGSYIEFVAPLPDDFVKAARLLECWQD